VALINRAVNEISIFKQCELLDMPRASYYYKPVTETEQNLLLMLGIDKLHLEHPYFGVLRMQAELSTAASPVNASGFAGSCA